MKILRFIGRCVTKVKVTLHVFLWGFLNPGCSTTGCYQKARFKATKHNDDVHYLCYNCKRGYRFQEEKHFKEIVYFDPLKKGRSNC